MSGGTSSGKSRRRYFTLLQLESANPSTASDPGYAWPVFAYDGKLDRLLAQLYSARNGPDGENPAGFGFRKDGR